MRSCRRHLVIPALALAAAACEPPSVDSDPLSGLLTHEAQRQALCARGRADAVTAVFCGADPPDITSLTDLEDALGMSFDELHRPGFAFTANSSALSARQVTAITPRVVMVRTPDQRDDASFMTIAYERGEGLVEMGVRPPGGDTALYLLHYEQPCDATHAGCTFEDRLTPATESGWSRWSLYDDVDLQDTVFDCLECHQPQGPGTPVDFRMPELQNPWTHWMAPFGEGELALFRDYGLAHAPDEDYDGVPARFILASNPIDVESFFKASGSTQVSPFPSQVIENEVKASAPGQPGDNHVAGHSATWDALYSRAVAGEVIPPPYHDVKITDAQKLSAMAAAYGAWRDGTLDGPLPDIRDVIRDDALADLSFRPKPGLGGRQILVHMCAQCHNSRLDQTLSRARFDVTHLDAMSRAEKDIAIDRLQRPANDRFRMPPHFMRDLSSDDIDACVAALRE